MIRLENVTKRYDGRAVIDSLSLEIRKGEVMVFLGPSGCGKTTTLKTINGLIPLEGGRILVGAVDVAATDATLLRRRIGYVIQEVGLFPHYTIAQNIGIVPRLLAWAPSRIADRIQEMLRLVNLPVEVLSRFPRELSGGQRQRVGVARALAGDPDILLMDEPFGAVDPVNRAFIRKEFRAIQDSLGKTVVIVTHDLDEALELGDRVAIFNQGRLAQVATPRELLARPATPFVAEFLGGDRGTRLLKICKVGDFLLPADGGSGPTIAVDATLSDALSELLLSGAQSLVATSKGLAVGSVTLEAIRRVAEPLAAGTPA